MKAKDFGDVGHLLLDRDDLLLAKRIAAGLAPLNITSSISVDKCRIQIAQEDPSFIVVRQALIDAVNAKLARVEADLAALGVTDLEPAPFGEMLAAA